MCGSSGTGVGGVDTTGYGLDNNDEIRYADEKGKTASHSRILGRRCTRFGAHSARARRSRSYFGLSTRSHSLAFRYPRHATIRVIVQVRRKRPSSRRAAKLPGRPLEPWDELQMDILKNRHGFSFLQRVPSTGSRSSLQLPVRFPSRH